MQCSVYIRIQDGGDRTHGKIIARASPYRKCGVGADFLTETRRTQRTVIRLRSSDSYLCTRHRGPAALHRSSFRIQHSELNPPPGSFARLEVALHRIGHLLAEILHRVRLCEDGFSQSAVPQALAPPRGQGGDPFQDRLKSRPALSEASRAVFAAWHGLHRLCKLVHSFVPPLCSGTM
jgi:hypothetical protein